MPHLPSALVAATLLACAPLLRAGESLDAFADAFSNAPHRDWLSVSGASHHFQPHRRAWREFNPGVGFERSFNGTPWVASAGYFRNSYDRDTWYLGGRWMPLAAGPFRFGAFGLLASGYPSPVLVLPAVSVEAGRVGANLVALPNLPGYSGYLGLQVRVALD